jgi:ferredoxin--NADP+ reductase
MPGANSTENLIIFKKRLSENTVRIEVTSPLIAKKALPGQFVILRVHARGERIPLTIADSSPEKETITLIFQEVGKSTLMLGCLNEGDHLHDLVGPLGHPTPIENYGTAVVVAGGLGTAEMYPIARALRAAGNHVVTIVGARREDLLVLLDEMRSVSDEVIITTDDGSAGRKGVVTDPLKELVAAGRANFVITCGPVIMMKFVAAATREAGILTMASLNPIMVDGTGMCGVCRVSVGGKVRYACVDGPDFNAHEVDFEELMLRQKAYCSYEQQALELWRAEHAHECKAIPPKS